MWTVIEVQIELHVIRVELRIYLRVLGSWSMFVDLRVKGDLYMGLGLCRGRVENDDMNLLKVFEQSVQVVESQATAGVVPAKLSLPVKHIEGIHDGITLDRRRLPSPELVQVDAAQQLCRRRSSGEPTTGTKRARPP
jgi:hypothetical protein